MPDKEWSPDRDDPSEIQERLLKRADEMLARVQDGPLGFGMPIFGSMVDQIDRAIGQLRGAPERYQAVLPPLFEVRRRLLQALLEEGGS